MKQYVAAKAERIELTLCENIAFSGGEIIPDRPPFVEIDPDDVPITNCFPACRRRRSAKNDI